MRAWRALEAYLCLVFFWVCVGAAFGASGRSDARDPAAESVQKLSRLPAKTQYFVSDDFDVRGQTIWFVPLPFSLTVPSGWRAVTTEAYNPALVFVNERMHAQVELYWLVLFERMDLLKFIATYESLFQLTVESRQTLAHPDGVLVRISATVHGLVKDFFFLKRRQRVFIFQCTATNLVHDQIQPDYFSFVDNFRLFDDYEIR